MKLFLILLILSISLNASIRTKTIIIEKNRMSKCPNYTTYQSEIKADVINGKQIYEKVKYKLCEQENIFILEIVEEKN